jgi:hypothetical protein
MRKKNEIESAKARWVRVHLTVARRKNEAVMAGQSTSQYNNLWGMKNEAERRVRVNPHKLSYTIISWCSDKAVTNTNNCQDKRFD